MSTIVCLSNICHGDVIDVNITSNKLCSWLLIFLILIKMGHDISITSGRFWCPVSSLSILILYIISSFFNQNLGQSQDPISISSISTAWMMLNNNHWIQISTEFVKNSFHCNYSVKTFDSQFSVTRFVFIYCCFIYFRLVEIEIFVDFLFRLFDTC